MDFFWNDTKITKFIKSAFLLNMHNYFLDLIKLKVVFCDYLVYYDLDLENILCKIYKNGIFSVVDYWFEIGYNEYKIVTKWLHELQVHIK